MLNQESLETAERVGRKKIIMYLYVELWKARQPWLDLSAEERKSWLDKILAGLQEQLQSGAVEPVGLVRNDDEIPHSAGFDFFAVWKMRDKNAARKFEDFVENAGWHDYFEQVNAGGKVLEMEDFVADHLNQ